MYMSSVRSPVYRTLAATHSFRGYTISCPVVQCLWKYGLIMWMESSEDLDQLASVEAS